METLKVYAAINKVQAALASEGISKNRKNQQQGYNFRGIDDIYNAVSSLLAESGLCILPRVLNRDCVERTTAKGGVLFYVTVEVEFDFVSAEDGSKHTVKTYGEAMDSGDKATNKAMSAAYKYALMQAFAIPTEGDNDADAHTHELAPRRESSKSEPVSAWDKLDAETKEWMLTEAMNVTAMTMKGDIEGAYMHLEGLQLDDEQKTAFWSRLDTSQRSGIKAYSTIIHAKTADALERAWAAVPKHSQKALEAVKEARKAFFDMAESNRLEMEKM